MLRARYLATLLCFAFTAGGCCTGENDDTAMCADAVPCDGDYRIENKNDLKAIAQCENISGVLTFASQSWITSIELPCLSSVDGELYIRKNGALTSIDMSALTMLNSLNIWNNASLTNLEIPALEMIDSLHIHDNDALTSLEIHTLTTVGIDLHIVDNASLTSLDMPALTTVGGVLDLGPHMGRLRAIDISDNAALRSLDGLSSLTSVAGWLGIYANDCLSQTEAETFTAALTVDGIVSVSSNGANFPCN